ncbi:MAG: sulfite exporter TauE/SafE family protein [Xanthomonadales bacterium]|nr:sulfite exporter TauE/SafE family protein [Xanthomonadales bacterium]
MYLLALLFLVTAFAYASVGFGGGSTYNALLVLSGTDFRVIPAIALSCNILVVSGGAWHYHVQGALRLRQLLPFVALSMPMAWLGGSMPIDERSFVGLLGLTLLISAVLMFRQSASRPEQFRRVDLSAWQIGLPCGAAIGLLSGVVGVGGGIFLAPLLYLFSSIPARQIAGLASGFILVNSLFGLAGQLGKHAAGDPFDAWLGAWPLFLAVIVGGQAGSRLGARVLPEASIRKLTGVLVLYVSVRLLLRWLELGH